MERGVTKHTKAPQLSVDDTTSISFSAIFDWLRWATDSHRRVAASIGYALTLGGPDGWLGLPAIFKARLNERERAMMAYAALQSIDAGNAESVVRAAMGAADGPLPTFLSPMDDARFWASMANGLELKAYALAAFEMMGQRDQVAFLEHVADRQVAA
jgi:hypothetical protein